MIKKAAMTDERRTEKLNRVREVADRLATTDDTVYKLINNGSLRAVKVGRNWRIPDSAVDAFIASGGARTATHEPTDHEPTEAAVRQRVETAYLQAYRQGYEDRAAERDYDPGVHR